MQLVTPSRDLIAAYVDALDKGWSPDNLRPEARTEQFARIAADPDEFLSAKDDPEAQGGPVRLPDGTTAARLPSLRLWIVANGFCGTIGLRWQPGTEALPPHCAGHIGYAVVPWRRREGLASAALLAFLPQARARGLRYVELTTDEGNVASRRVIEKAGGVLTGTAPPPVRRGGDAAALSYRIAL